MIALLLNIHRLIRLNVTNSADCLIEHIVSLPLGKLLNKFNELTRVILGDLNHTSALLHGTCLVLNVAG